MSRFAIESGPDIDEGDEVCPECQGAGELRNDFGEEWTCEGCDGSGRIW